ncbi:hypothetical protein F183_A38370 [Bryobacterales bacterium F-183]|nr:hypothetical protein F183_A38370 [Bryobacterales bacterium F-183]
MPRRRSRILLAAFLAAIFVFSLTYKIWLPWFGTHLVAESALLPVTEKVDAVVVLAGDSFGLRVLKGAELVVREGVAPVALVSGPSHVYGVSEAKLAVDLAERAGYDRTKLEPLPFDHFSTEEEAASIAAEIRRRGMKRVIVVTSNYHTGRSERIWKRQAGGDFTVRMVAARDHDVVPETWWKTREARKKIFSEWLKRVTGPFGI